MISQVTKKLLFSNDGGDDDDDDGNDGNDEMMTMMKMMTMMAVRVFVPASQFHLIFPTPVSVCVCATKPE